MQASLTSSMSSSFVAVQAVRRPSVLAKPACLSNSSSRWSFHAQLASKQPRQAWPLWRPIRPKRVAQIAAAGKTAAAGKLISSTEIPAFIPRQDFMDQLFRWAQMEAAEDGAKTFGLPMKVAPIYKEGTKMLWGMSIGIVRDGATVANLEVKFDDEVVVKRAYVGRGADGFPAMEGASDDIDGKHFEIRKVDDNPVDEQLRGVIRTFCQGIVSAINRYYAFGSCFTDDSQ